MRSFYKMTGSGNDFVFFDTRGESPDRLMSQEAIRAVCARGTGVGADGVVFVEPAPDADIGIRYLNSDGSAASLCGNATLCAVRFASHVGIPGRGADLRIRTEAGVLAARMAGGTPEFDLGAIERITPTAPIGRASGEARIGFAVAGVPHVVVLVQDIGVVDVEGRGRVLRSDPWLGSPGANVNFVAPVHDLKSDRTAWRMRTYERGVEGETLACGTGAVAVAALLASWHGPADRPTRLWTQSGAPLDVTVRQEGSGSFGTLRGEGRLVFRGELEEGGRSDSRTNEEPR